MANRFEGEEELALEEELHEVMHESGETGEGEGILGAIGNVLGGLPAKRSCMKTSSVSSINCPNCMNSTRRRAGIR